MSGDMINISGPGFHREQGCTYTLPTQVTLVAEMSANHNGSIDRAEAIIRAAADSGADAVKLQTYTADTMTIDSNKECFRIKGTIWEGCTLYDLYREAYTPWEWTPHLIDLARGLGMDCFSTPFDVTAVDFLEECHVSRYKIASFELVDIPLLKKIAATGKPVILSTGMATLAEIDEAVRTLRDNHAGEITLLKCTSAYPAPPDEAHLRTIPHLAQTFSCKVGLSDHTIGSAVPVAAVALGATLIEKHFTLSKADGGPDATFSIEPEAFAQMVHDVRTVEKALGNVSYRLTPAQEENKAFRRSLFVVQDIHKGEVFTSQNVRSIRPGYGMHPRYLSTILGRKAPCDIERGTPLTWELV